MKIIPISIVICYQKCHLGLKLWLQKRQTSDEFQGLLEFPGGKIEPNETPLIAALREFKEETQSELDAQSMRFFNMYEEELENKTVQLFCFLFEDQKNQMQSDGYVLLSCNESDLDDFLSKIPYSNRRLVLDLLSLVEI